jgi:hypothetical protein
MGITSSALSARFEASSTQVISASMAMPRWVRMAPLGRPVVPEVYIRHQASSGWTAASGSLSEAEESKSS